MEGRLDVDHRIPGVDARLERLADARVDRLDVLARDRAADDLVDELVTRALLARLEAVLNGPIADELRALKSRSNPP